MKKTKLLKSCMAIILMIVLIIMCTISSTAVTTKKADTKSNGGNTDGEYKITERLKAAMDLQSASKGRERLKSATDQEGGSKIPVMVWLEDTDTGDLPSKALKSAGLAADTYEQLISDEEITLEEIQSYIEEKRAKAAERYKEYNEEKVKTYFKSEEIIYVSKYSPVILVNMDSDAIMETAEKNDVVFMDSYLESNETELTMANHVTRAANVHNSYGYGGAGVKVGVFEVYLPNASFPGVNIVSKYGEYEPPNLSQEASRHANSVMQTVSSVAPAASYYVASSSSNTNISNMEAIEWLISKGVNVITASRTIGKDDKNTYGSMSKWLDHIAYNHDVHFVKNTGLIGGYAIER